MNDPLVTPAGTPPRRWIFWALLASAAVNLLLIGLFIGHLMHPALGWRGMHGAGFAAERERGGMMDRALRDLPREERKEIREFWEERRKAARPRIEALREARDEARKAMTAEPFDKAKAAAALAEVRRRGDALQAELHASLIESAAKLPPEVRARLGEMRGPLFGPPPRGERP